MTSAETAYIGRFSFDMVPFFAWLLSRYADPAVKKIVCRKPAQIGWTQSVISVVLGFIAHIKKSTCIVMFPKEGAARNFDREKFGPMVESTPVLRTIFPQRSRSRDVNTLFKSFLGGFIKFVGSNSIADVKSTSAQDLIVEEPDDCNLNLRGQGDSIKLLEERGKGYRSVKILIGGTPSAKGASSIDDEYAQSDQNEWHVPCPDCGEHQALEWEQVVCSEDPALDDPLYGSFKTETTAYACVHCGSLWDDVKKNVAIQRGKPVAQAAFRGVVGLSLNELYSCMFGSRLQVLMERYLKAKKAFDEGKPEELTTFWNACLGRAYEYSSDGPTDEDLEKRGMDYPASTVPAGGLVLTAGVDFQQDRIAVIIRAWGRGEESWLVYWDEIYGNVFDRAHKVWTELDDLLFGRYRHACGALIAIRAASLDSSDGNTAEQVYDYIRSRNTPEFRKQHPHASPILMAIKGSSTPGREIFRQPAPVDTKTTAQKGTKAAKKGLQVFMVGTERAKDTLLGQRLALEGHGPNRFHWYKTVRNDYLLQLRGEVKVPGAAKNRAKVWVPKTGVRHEVLDGEVYAMHAARRLKVHTQREENWAQLERQIKQGSLLEPPSVPEIEADSAPEDEVIEHQGETAVDSAAEDTPAPPPVALTQKKKPAAKRAGGFATNW